MKKATLFLAVLSLTGLICGCDNNDPSEEPEPTPDTTKKELVFKKGDETRLWPGDIREVDILTEGSYTIKSIDNEIASVEPITSCKFKVTAKNKGETQTLITDKEGNEYTFLIWVRDEAPFGDWVDIPERFEVKISTSDLKTKTAIENDLGPKRIDWAGATYNFNPTQKTFKTYGSEDLSGTYTFDIYSKKMEFIYNGNKDTFTIITDPQYGEVLTLYEDLTDYYKEQFPDGSIQKVSTSRTLTSKTPI